MGAAILIGVLAAAAGMAAQAGGETFTATATVKSPAKSASVPITFKIDRFVTDAERTKIIAAVKTNDPNATRAALEATPDVGYIELGAKRTPIKFAFPRSTGGGRLITLVTAKPVYFVGGTEPQAKPKEGYDLAVALLVLDANDSGTGEIAPATKVKVNDSGALVTEEYGSEVVRLTNITKAKGGTSPM